MALPYDFSKLEYIYPVCNINDITNTIEHYGVAVVPNILTEMECHEIITRANQWLEDKPKNEQDKVKVNDKGTWKNISKVFYANHGGLMQYFNVGQAQFVWDVRQNPKVKNIFESIWQTEDLIVSFDGCNITPPPEITNRGWQSSNKHWLHTDQGNDKIGLKSIQGLANLESVDVGDATLCVLRSSNKYHEEFFATNNKQSKGDWYKLDDKDAEWFLNKDCAPYGIKAKKGDMILWDSRTIHMGLSPSKHRLNKEKWRYVIYVCMFPRQSMKEKDLNKRRKYFEDGRMTNHWSTKLFPKNPHTYGSQLYEMNEYTKPYLNEIGMSLL